MKSPMGIMLYDNYQQLSKEFQEFIDYMKDLTKTNPMELHTQLSAVAIRMELVAVSARDFYDSFIKSPRVAVSEDMMATLDDSLGKLLQTSQLIRQLPQDGATYSGVTNQCKAIISQYQLTKGTFSNAVAELAEKYETAHSKTPTSKPLESSTERSDVRRPGFFG